MHSPLRGATSPLNLIACLFIGALLIAAGCADDSGGGSTDPDPNPDMNPAPNNDPNPDPNPTPNPDPVPNPDMNPDQDPDPPEQCQAVCQELALCPEFAALCPEDFLPTLLERCLQGCMDEDGRAQILAAAGLPCDVVAPLALNNLDPENVCADDPPEGEVCFDNEDNDGDNLIDCDDPDCDEDVACTEQPVEICDDDEDNDGDEAIDCDDIDCAGDEACIEPGDEICNDNIDNDDDNAIDCDDPDCGQAPNCQDPPEDEICDDEIDNDQDNATDCEDLDCEFAPNCQLDPIEDQCDDGEDNDGDNRIDCLDIDCIQAPNCIPEDATEIAPQGESLGTIGAINDDAPLFIRPLFDCTRRQDMDTYFYDITVLTNNSGADQTLTITANWAENTDGYLFAYNAPFNPLEPIDNCLIGNDDFSGRNNSRVGNIQIANGGFIVIVATTFRADTPIGLYSLEVLTNLNAELLCEDLSEEIDGPGSYEGTLTPGVGGFSPSCVFQAQGRETIYAFTPEADGQFCLDTNGSNYDTILSVRENDCIEGLEVACNDDINFPENAQSIVTLDATGGNTYYIYIDAFSSGIQEGINVLNVAAGPCE